MERNGGSGAPLGQCSLVQKDNNKCTPAAPAVRGRIVLVGDVEGPQHYQVGDEAMFTACCDWLKGRFGGSVELVGVSADPRWTAKAHGISAIQEPRLPQRAPAGKVERLARRYGLLGRAPLPSRRIYRTFAAAPLLRQSSLLYICGGGNISSIYPEPFRLRSFLAMLAQQFGVPVVLSGQTLGPIYSEADRALLRGWLPRAAYVGVRDRHVSGQLAQSLGVAPERIGVRADDAFLIRAEPAAGRLYARNPVGPLIGVSIHRCASSRLSAEEVLDCAAQLLDAVVERFGAQLLFLPHVTSDRPQMPYDVQYGRALQVKMRLGASLTVVEQVLEDRVVKALTAECDFVISTRYHPMVFALASGVPCVGLAQDEHTQTAFFGLFNVMGLQPSCFDLSSAAGEPVLNLLQNRHSLKSEINSCLPAARREIEAELDRLGEIIRGALAVKAPGRPVRLLQAEQEPAVREPRKYADDPVLRPGSPDL